MRKLLKYDMRSVFNVWWISTLSVLAFFVVGVFSLRGMQSIDSMRVENSNLPLNYSVMKDIYSLLLLLTFMAMVAYATLNLIMVLRRFYTNLFTDQGYLTFTLPVSRTKVMASKFIMGYVYMLACSFVLMLGIAAFTIFDTADGLINYEFFERLHYVLTDLWSRIGWMTVVYAVELLLMVLAAEACALLLYYTCITVGSVLVKKYKIPAAIGIYYGGNMVVTYAAVFYLIAFFDSSFGSCLEQITEQWQQHLFANALIVMIIAALALVAWLLFYFNVRLLHKKLNLA